MIREITTRQIETGWIAFETGREDEGAQGFGKTREDAIEDLHAILDSEQSK